MLKLKGHLNKLDLKLKLKLIPNVRDALENIFASFEKIQKKLSECLRFVHNSVVTLNHVFSYRI